MLKDVPPYQPFVDALNDAYRPFHPEFAMHQTPIRAVMTNVQKEPRSVKDDLDVAARDINVLLDQFNARQGTKR